ncbi:beta-1,4 N-acetylgalactosaminyltransferase 1-like [Scyliorhinus canicula]|uniref:beta-1,4 N-acetylgalactosaminyltransferase 1-like n=1 Tax=Scyliorhinus canicula TaxID=7830 RepID=UPI0018F7C0A2|nr:beta-1,4 N-acetylgalactosaminyltransferase 1-like [Scyliorhinus canicula]
MAPNGWSRLKSEGQKQPQLEELRGQQLTCKLPLEVRWMRIVKKKACCLGLICLLLVMFIFYRMQPGYIVDINYKSERMPRDLFGYGLGKPGGQYSHIPHKTKNTVVRRLTRNDCNCEGEETLLSSFVGQGSVTQLELVFDAAKRHEVTQRREKEYQHFLQRTRSSADTLLIAKANSPLEYPIQGVEVRPMKTILIPGQKKPTERLTFVSRLSRDVIESYKLFRCGGVLYIVNTEGGIIERLLLHQNERWSHTVLCVLGYNISGLVTIATKTFLRYDKLRQLISSIRKYYPSVTIIIADDNRETQKIEGAFIDQYFMPFQKGWFAGRNLAASQVKTKYLLWVDDDFIFASDTKLEKMVDILEKTTLDLVGGSVREITTYSATFLHKLSVEQGGKGGDCLMLHRGHYHQVEGFPNCFVTDATINFFMARTEKVQQVGFDPHITRQGHLEFFVDGLGLLHVGSCSDVMIDHASKITMPWRKKSESEQMYHRLRYVQGSEVDGSLQNKLFYFKNRFKCIRYG